MESQYDSKKQFIINIIYIFLIASIAYVFFRYAISLVSPFIFAFLIAYFLKKPARKISISTKLPYKIVSFFVILVFYIIAGFLVSLVGVKIISTISRIISLIPILYEKQLVPFLITTFDVIEDAVYNIDPAIVEVLNEGFNQFVRTLGQYITNVSLRIVGSLSNIASSLPGFFIKVLLMIISTFFIAIDFDVLSSFMKRQFSKEEMRL